MIQKTNTAVLSASAEYILANEQVIDLTVGSEKITLAPTRFIKTDGLTEKQQEQVLALLKLGSIPIVMTK